MGKETDFGNVDMLKNTSIYIVNTKTVKYKDSTRMIGNERGSEERKKEKREIRIKRRRTLNFKKLTEGENRR